MNDIQDSVVITMHLDNTFLKKDITDLVERKVTDEFSKQIKDIMIEKGYSRYGRYTVTGYDLTPWAKEMIKKAVAEYKDEIIAAAAKTLAESMRKSKPVRERFCDVLGEELEG